jgi:hypothetical protein
MAHSNWDETKARLIARWPLLPEAELDATAGDPEAILALLEIRLGYARANAEGDLNTILAGGGAGGALPADPSTEIPQPHPDIRRPAR